MSTAPRIDPRERESLLRDLESVDEEVRRLAVERSASLPADEALPLVMGRLGDASWRVRKAAVERLVAMPMRDLVARTLVGVLSDGDNPGLRNAALEALIRCGESATPTLLEASRDEDSDVRKQVVDAIAGIGDPRASARLGELLGDRDPNVRGAVADAMGMLGLPELAPPLLRAAHDDMERLVRLSALRALTRLEIAQPASEVAPLIHDPHLRAAAFELLGHADDGPSIDLLLKGLESSSRSAREAAIASLLRVLGRCDPLEAEDVARRIRDAALSIDGLVSGVIGRLGEAALPQRFAAIQFLGVLGGGEAVLAILEAARDEALRPVARDTLVGLGSLAEESLVAHWEQLDGELRLVAAQVLGATRGTAAEPCLLLTLSDRDPGVRAAAARALGERGSREALARLVERLHAAAGADPIEGGETEAEALCDAIVVLAASPDGEGETSDAAVARLLAGLSGGREAYRYATARILARLGRADHPAASDLLLSDPSPAVRRAAVEGLGEVPSERSAEPLRLALADEAAEVRTAAAACLAHRSHAAAFEQLTALARDPAPTVRAAALRAIGQRLARNDDAGERTSGLLLFEEGLTDDGTVAMAVADALVFAGGADAARIAVGLLGRREPELVQAAVRCIARHGDANAARELLPLLSHDAWAVRAQTVQSLAGRGATEAVPPILRRLEFEQDPFVREAVLAALRQLEG